MRSYIEVWIERNIPQCWGIPRMHYRQNHWKCAATDILALRKQCNYASATYTEFRNKVQCTLVSWLLTNKTDEYLTKGQRQKIAEIHIKATPHCKTSRKKPSSVINTFVQCGTRPWTELHRNTTTMRPFQQKNHKHQRG